LTTERRLGTPWVGHHFGSSVTIFEWPIRGGVVCRIEIEPRDEDSIVRRVIFGAPARGALPVGGIPATDLHEFPLGRAVEESLRLVRENLDRIRDASVERARDPFPYELGPSELEALSAEASRQVGDTVVVESVLASGDAMIRRVSDGAPGFLVRGWTVATLERLGTPVTDRVAADPNWPRSPPGAVFQLAGFDSKNAYAVIRPRGRVVPKQVHAALAALYAMPGATRPGLAEQLGYSVGTIKSWIAIARSRGYLSAAPARELTPAGVALLEEDGRTPEQIVEAWTAGNEEAG
jgi:hypothetical protein